MVDINPTISIFTFKVSSLKAPIKAQILSEWIKKQKDKLHVVYKKFTLNIKVLCCAVLSHSAVSESLRPHGLQPARLPRPCGFSRQENKEVDMPSSRGFSQAKDRTQVSHIAREFCTVWATREAHREHNLKINGWKLICNTT